LKVVQGKSQIPNPKQIPNSKPPKPCGPGDPMLCLKNGLGLPVISPMIEREVQRRFSPCTVDEPSGGVVWNLEFSNLFGIWDLNVFIFHEMSVNSDFGFSVWRMRRENFKYLWLALNETGD
jgi:hypothetical protein